RAVPRGGPAFSLEAKDLLKREECVSKALYFLFAINKQCVCQRLDQGKARGSTRLLTHRNPKKSRVACLIQGPPKSETYDEILRHVMPELQDLQVPLHAHAGIRTVPLRSKRPTRFGQKLKVPKPHIATQTITAHIAPRNGPAG